MSTQQIRKLVSEEVRKQMNEMLGRKVTKAEAKPVKAPRKARKPASPEQVAKLAAARDAYFQKMGFGKYAKAK